MDRFSAPELDRTEWAKGSFDEGHRARFDGMGRRHAPSADVVGEFSRKSWLAGWSDADAAISADELDIPVNND